MSKPTISLSQSRAAVIELRPSDDGQTSIHAALSSETPVARGPFQEVLIHSADAIDMSRAAGGMPLTIGHSEMDPLSADLPVGRIDNIRLDPTDKKLRGDLVFDTDERSEMARGKIERGFADLSITYEIQNHGKPGKDGRVEVTRWQPRAASVVSVAADPNVGAGRADETTEAIMPDEKVTPEAGAASPTIIDTIKARSNAGMQAGMTAENERLGEINSLASGLSRSLPGIAHQIEELAEHARGDFSVTPDKFRALAFELTTGNPQPLSLEGDAGRLAPPSTPGMQHRGIVVPGDDMKTRAAEGMVLSLVERSGGKVDPDKMEGNQYRGWSMLDMARDCLELHGVSTRGLSSEQIARQAIMMGRAISPGTANYITSDFPAVTENVITKRIHDAYAAAPITWNRWCSSTTVPDFKQFTIPRLSQISDLPIVAENAAYTDLTQVDAKEAATLVKHGGLMSFSWEAIVNDDQRMFSRTSTSMGEAAARTVDVKAYAVLTANPGVGVQGIVMGDTNQLFDTTNHANADTGADLNLAGIVSTRTAIARQTDDNGEALGIELRHVIVPEELRDDADNLAGSEYVPWVEGGTPQTTRINTVRSTFQVTATIRLAAGQWYGASAMGGTVEVAFLNGNQSPAIMRDDGWDTDALHWKIRHPSVAYAVDWRGLYLNGVG